jgi:hypothetical protein
MLTPDTQTTRTTIPAHPGWYVAMFVRGGSGEGKIWPDYLDLMPILAWEIGREEGAYDRRAGRSMQDRWVSHEPIPITVEGNMNRMGNPWAIKTPDGKYVVPGLCSCDNEADILKELRDQLEWEEHAREQVASAPA